MTSGEVILSVSDREAINSRLRKAFSGDAVGSYITFETVEALWRIITPKRLEILRALAGGKPSSIREVARRVQRDVKAVHRDIHALADAGLLDLTPEGVRFGYDSIRIDVRLAAA